jgi:hypothetical protein
MYYIDGPGATPDHKFTDGDPAAGVAPTTVTDDFMNDVQQEILNVIAAAGMAPAKNTQDQLLKALRGLGGTGIFTTAPQFDNSKKGATTEFVQRALGSYNSFMAFENQAVPATPAHIGRMIHFFGGGANSYSPPDSVANGIPPGACITLNNWGGTNLGLVPQGGDKLQESLNGAATATLRNIPPDTQITMTFIGGGVWLLHGTGVVAKTYPWSKLDQQTGYQRYPSGLLVQWGLSAASSATVQITFPTAFAVGPRWVGAQDNGGSPTLTLWSPQSMTVTGFIASNICQLTKGSTTVNASVNSACPWLAIGF